MRARTWVIMAVIGLVAAMITACGGPKHAAAPSKPEAATPSPSPSGPMKVSPTTATTLKLPGGATVTAPVGSVSADGTLQGRVITPPVAAPDGTEFIGDVYAVTLANAQIVTPLTLSFPVTLPQIGGRSGPAPILVYLDPTTNAWTPFDSTYDASTKMLTAQTPHLTNWGLLFEHAADALMSGAESLFKKIIGVSDTAGQPSCPGTAQATTAGIVASSTSGSLLKWCIGSVNGDGYLRVANDRSFGIELDYPKSWASKDDGWTDIDAGIYDAIAKALTVAPNGDSVAIIAPGEIEDFTIPPGDSGNGVARPSPSAYLASVFAFGLETLVTISAKVPFAGVVAVDKAIKAFGEILNEKTCLTSMQSLIKNPVTDAKTALNLFYQTFNIASGCLSDQWEVAYGVSGAAWSFAMSVFSWIIDGIHELSAGIGATIESAAYYADYTIDVEVPQSVAVPPTLGQNWGGPLAQYQEGYGLVQPKSIYNGGDPTSVVENLTWSNWGGATSIGSGIGWWVPDGSDVAGGEKEPVKIYVFNLGTCNGHPSYNAIEWVFTEYGETFNPNAGYINDCTGDYH